MLRSRTLLIKNLNNFRNRFSSQIAVDGKRSEIEWKNAKQFNKIPGPKTFEFLRAFIPGGKYYNISMTEFSRKLRSEFGIIAKFPGFFGQRDMVFLFDPNDIETVFRNEGKWPIRHGIDTLVYFRAKHKPEWFSKGAGLVVTQGQEWADFRTKVNQVMLQPKNVKLYIPRIDDVAKEFIEKIEANLDENHETPEDFLDFLNQWALESIGVIAVNTRLGVLNNPKASKINSLLKDVFRLSFEYDVVPSIWRYYKTPGFKNVMKVYEEVTQVMKEHVEKGLQKIESKHSTNDHEDGVLEKLLNVDRHVAFVMALDSLLAGVDTTSLGALSVLYCLAKNPDKQEILRQEILKILPQKDSQLTNQSLNHIPYLRAVVKESLRLYSPTNGNLRATGQDMVINGYQIPKNTEVVLANHVLSLDEYIFPKSTEFIPERWIKENDDPVCPHARDSHPFAYLPFGFGPRMCIGRRFAELEIEVLVIRLIRQFRLEWNYPDLKFNVSLLNTPVGALKFKFNEL